MMSFAPRLASTLLLMASAAFAGQTDVASSPIGTSSTISAKPNIMFLLDDSGSMNWSFMPDALGLTLVGADMPFANRYGYASVQCNGVAYDPGYSYQPPVTATGVPFAAATFSAAPTDGYVTGSPTTDLNNSVYYTYHGTNPAMGWTYDANGVVTTTSFYGECLGVIGSAPGNAVFTAVTVTSASAEAQNYANWYSYYRKRYLTLRSDVGRAFSTLDSNYRIGFSVISDTTVTSGTRNFLDIGDFTSSQKASFYASLYGSPSQSTTPLRKSLSKIGQYFARKAAGQSVDPVQYACQRNYTILATDGYWNGVAGTQLDGTTPVGQQDGTEARPMFDGNFPASTAVNTWAYWEWDVYNPPTVSTCAATQYAAFPFLQQMTETDQIVSSVSNGVSKVVVMPPLSGTYAWNNIVPPPVCLDPAAVLSKNLTGGVPFTTGKGSYYFSSSGTDYKPSPTQILLTPGPSSPAPTSGPFDTLADVAEYYYKTDLRSSALGNCTGALGTDVCADSLTPNGLDTATWQHMTTFTIGLGVNGTLAFDPNYLTQPTDVYSKLVDGTINWPVPDGGAANIDDLWHAAVNGRGQYFSATNSGRLAQSVSSALAAAKAVNGTGAGAGVSSLQPVPGANNQGFISSFETVDWTGDLQAHPMDAASGAIDTATLNWSAQKQLDAQPAASRTIYYMKPASATTAAVLQPFDLTHLTDDGHNGAVENFCSQPSPATQCAGLDAAQLAAANSGDNLVNYLRGEAGNEIKPGSTTPLYRARKHKLGDIVNAAPSYVGPARFSYADTGYSDFATTQASRKPMVYVAANDGMLHAFSADPADGTAQGDELWAYIPSMVLPRLYRLADASYSTRHQYLVDGSPQAGDIQVGSDWKTILVGGLAAGGAGYYALDITDPAKPLALWEFSDKNLGLSYGNPVITKLKNGTWVVVVTSGLNNVDGLGHLFVLDANTGTKLADLVTTVGETASPSGLTKIGSRVEDVSDNTAMYFYGGDLLGNLWRFDVDKRLSATGNGVTLLATFQISTSTPQPITTAPFPIQIKTGSATSAASVPGVLVTTGRFLGTTDISDTTQQSIYVLKDPLTTTGLGDVRAGGHLVTQSVTVSGKTGTLSTNPIDWTTAAGWKLDLPLSGERIVVDPLVQFSATSLISMTPGSGVCPPTTGTSNLYVLNVNTGASLLPDSGVFIALGQPAAGVAWLVAGSGNTVEVTKADGTVGQQKVQLTSATAAVVRRTSWRELIQ